MSALWIVLALLPIIGGAERFNCRGRILGAYYADAKSGCKAFHVCVKVAGGGVRDFRFFCPPGTLFHQEAQTCTDWGDDDPLACPAEVYDGQFDLYKIGSVYDTKKVSSSANREEESDYGLQRAETGDLRLSQNSISSNAGASDLRTAHSSDFFSGQRDRGRDEQISQTQSPVSVSHFRQSFRKPTTRIPTSTSQFTTPFPTSPPQPHTPIKYDPPKRKSIRKRPIYVSTSAPEADVKNTIKQQTYSEQPQQVYQDYNRRPIANSKKETPKFINPPDQLQQEFNTQVSIDNKKVPPTLANLPAKYHDEYIEVSKVTPKNSQYFQNSANKYTSPTQAPTRNNEGLVELYNFDAQSTPGLKFQNEKFKVKNSFNVQTSKEPDFNRARNINFNNDRGISTSTDFNSARGANSPDYRNFNSVSYEPEKNNFVQFSASKQNYFNNPTTTPSTTTLFTTNRPYNNFNVNTVAYNTNVGFSTVASSYAESGEDDGQYRPPQGEDDGQYRPELYEKDAELLSGAHSLNIAASGNRLPDDQKKNKNKLETSHSKPNIAVPRPFRPAPNSISPSTTQNAETYPTTAKQKAEQTTQRAFDYYQTYTTTSRPYDVPSAPEYTFVSIITPSSTPRVITDPTVRSKDIAHTRTTTTSFPPQHITKSSTRPPQFANPPNKKEDASYDYAYYDSDSGFSEYDHVQEFSRTKSKV